MFQEKEHNYSVYDFEPLRKTVRTYYGGQPIVSIGYKISGGERFSITSTPRADVILVRLTTILNQDQVSQVFLDSESVGFFQIPQFNNNNKRDLIGSYIRIPGEKITTTKSNIHVKQLYGSSDSWNYWVLTEFSTFLWFKKIIPGIILFFIFLILVESQVLKNFWKKNTKYHQTIHIFFSLLFLFSAIVVFFGQTNPLESNDIHLLNGHGFTQRAIYILDKGFFENKLVVTNPWPPNIDVYAAHPPLFTNILAVQIYFLYKLGVDDLNVGTFFFMGIFNYIYTIVVSFLS